MSYETKHFLKKLLGTVRILMTLGLARTFGEYKYSSESEHPYARYKWRGQTWHFPTGPLEPR